LYLQIKKLLQCKILKQQHNRTCNIFEKYILKNLDSNFRTYLKETDTFFESLFLEFKYFGYDIGTEKLKIIVRKILSYKLRNLEKVEKFFIKYKKIIPSVYLSHFDNPVIPEEVYEYHYKNFKSSAAEHPNISLDFLLRHRELLENNEISGNPNLTEEFCEQYLLTRKNFRFTHINCKFSDQFLKKHLDRFSKNNLLMSPFVSEKFIEDNFEMECPNINYILSRKNLSYEFIEKHKSKLNWDIIWYSRFPLDLEFIEKYFDKVNLSTLCTKEYLPLEFIEKYESKFSPEQIKDIIRHNQNINEKFYEKYFESIDWCSIYLNKNIKQSFFEENIEYVYWEIFLVCGNIKPDILEKCNYILKYDTVGSNIHIGQQFFENLLKERKLWKPGSSLYRNTSLSPDFFEKCINGYPDDNQFSYEKNIEKELSEEYLYRYL
jgi:hypothetical protein